MKFYVFPVLFSLLLISGCGSKRIYGEEEFFYNPSSVWTEFKYSDYENFDVAISDLRSKLKGVWEERIQKKRFTTKSTNNIDSIVKSLAPKDGSPVGGNCKNKGKGVVVLLHGLYDSPYTMKDIGKYFNRECYHTRFILLPGHGTVPGDLRHLCYEKWVAAVRHTVKQARTDYKDGKLILVGFSTGAGLALNYTVDHPEEIDAMVLFAPLVEVGHFRVIAAYAFEALFEYIDKKPEIDTYKYESVPANSVIQANRLADSMRGKLQDSNLNNPVFIAQAWNDYTLMAKETAKLFDRQYFGENAVFLLYAPSDVDGFTSDCRQDSRKYIFEKTNKVACNSNFIYPAAGADTSTKAIIDGYSHMSLTLSPTDPHYGIQKNYRYCLHYNKATNLVNCNQLTGPNVCHGERAMFSGRHESTQCPKNKTVIIRLTSNPRFEFLKNQLTRFLKKHGL